METAIQLLMNDGAARLTFHPRLSGENYSELMDVVQACGTKAELREAAQACAARWGIAVIFDDMSVG